MLILINRPGIQVICGNVAAVDTFLGTVTIRGDVAAGDQTIKVDVTVHSALVSKMRFELGSTVVAAVKSTEELALLADGIFIPGHVYECNAFVIRYTGAFDFDDNEGLQEEHVFCGTISREAVLANGSTLFLVSWKRKGETQQRRLLSQTDIRPGLGPHKNVFVTGRKITRNDGDLYMITGSYPAV